MERNPNAQAVSEALKTQLELDSAALDTKAKFEVWLDQLRPGQPINTARPQARLVGHLKGIHASSYNCIATLDRDD